MKKPDYVHAGIAHFDISGPEVERLGPFYSAVFGWKLDQKGPGYSLVETPDGSPNGAVSETPEASLTIGVTVEDLAATLKEVEAKGGKTVMPMTDNGWVKKAQIADVAGNILTLIEI